MKNFKQLIGMSLLGLTVTLCLSGAMNAQDRDRDRDRDGRYDRRDNRRDNDRSDRWRYRRGGRWYNTDSRRADMLRAAVNEGYRRGYEAGSEARSTRRRGSWRNHEWYRTGDSGYNDGVERSEYRYYFQQGFQRGYQDGYSRRNRYGSNNTILGNVLNQIFNVQRY